MKRRHPLRVLLNLFSLCLLAFALYLNFVRKEVPELPSGFGAGADKQAVETKEHKTASLKTAGHTAALK